jgi:hypothetical protein
MKQPYVPPELLYPQPPMPENTAFTQQPQMPQNTAFTQQPPMPQNTAFTQQPPMPQNTAFTQQPPMPCYSLVPVNSFAAQRTQKTGAWPFIIWSLILVVFFNPIGTPLSLISAILSVLANAETDRVRRDRKLSFAAVMCVIATVADVVTFIFLATATIHILRGM